MKVPFSTASPGLASLRSWTQPVRAGEAEGPSEANPTDTCQFSPSSPPRPAPRAHPRGYMWEGAPIGGIVGSVLTAVVGFGPMPRWLRLEPPPTRDPQVRALGFAWNQVSDSDFASHCQRLEKALEQGSEAGKKVLGGGGNSSYLVELDTGPAAVWKPAARQKKGKHRDHLPEGNEGLREAAAYRVDKWLGHLARVPVASSTGLAGREGTLSLLVPGTPARDLGDREELLARLRPDDYRRIALFDYVIGNLDRHGGNWLVDGNLRPIPIDHGLAFPTRNAPQSTLNLDFRQPLTLNASERERLSRFAEQESEIRSQLATLLEPEALDAMFERVQRALQRGSIDTFWCQPEEG